MPMICSCASVVAEGEAALLARYGLQTELLTVDNADIKEGDLLVTSGMAQRFPAGYPVGVVTRVERATGQPFAMVHAAPAAALDRSRHFLLVFAEGHLPHAGSPDDGDGMVTETGIAPQAAEGNPGARVAPRSPTGTPGRRRHHGTTSGHRSRATRPPDRDDPSGIIIGMSGGEVFNYLLNILAGSFGGEKIDLFYTPLWFAALIISFSTFVGLATGFYPARRAAKINCLEALRYK